MATIKTNMLSRGATAMAPKGLTRKIFRVSNKITYIWLRLRVALTNRHKSASTIWLSSTSRKLQGASTWNHAKKMWWSPYSITSARSNQLIGWALGHQDCHQSRKAQLRRLGRMTWQQAVPQVHFWQNQASWRVYFPRQKSWFDHLLNT